MTRRGLRFVLASALCPALAFADEGSVRGYGAQSGIELEGVLRASISESVSSELLNTEVALAPSAGYFVLDGLEVALAPHLRWYRTAGENLLGRVNTELFIGAEARVRYVLDLRSDLYPFVSAGLGYATRSGDDPFASGLESSTLVSAELGIKLALGRSSLVGVAARYQHDARAYPSGSFALNELLLSASISLWIANGAAPEPAPTADRAKTLRYSSQGGVDLEGFVGGAYSRSPSITSVLVTIQPRVGYFVFDGVELAASPGLFVLSYDDDVRGNGETAVTAAGSAHARYVFDLESRFYPYAGVAGGLSKGITYRGGIGTRFAAELGVKLAWGELGLVGVGVEYEHFDQSYSDIFTAGKTNTLLLTTSLSVWLPDDGED